MKNILPADYCEPDPDGAAGVLWDGNNRLMRMNVGIELATEHDEVLMLFWDHLKDQVGKHHVLF